MRDRKVSVKIFSTIDDIPIKQKREPTREFRSKIPDSLFAKFDEACEKKGYERHELFIIILESFLNGKKV